MFKDFFNKNVDYFWEYEYPFGAVFLKGIYPNQYKRKYSLIGDGIFNLIYIDNKIYEVKFKSAKFMLENDNKSALRDNSKDKIVNSICENLEKNNIEYTKNSGKFITFKIGDFIAKVEIIKKMKEPQ